MKTVATIAMTTALLAAPSFAHLEIDGQCDMELHGSLKFMQGELTVSTDDGSDVVITEDHQLYVDNQYVSLNSAQQRWVSDYYENIESAIPMTVEIASEGLEIASYAVSEVFGELLGADHSLVEDFSSMFDELSVEIQDSFYAADGSYQFDTSALESNWDGSAWEQEFEARLESLIERSMGHILVAVGREMIFGDGDMDAFAERMENFGETIEYRIEDRADGIEAKADALCNLFAQADYVESKMQSGIPELSNLNLLELDKGKMLK